MANKVSDFFISINHIVRPMLESPLHWLLSPKLALIRYTGRKSGQTFTTPVAYHAYGDRILIALEETEGRNWWKNFREEWPIEMLIKGRWRAGNAIVIPPGSDEFYRGFEAIFRSLFFIPAIFGIRYDAKEGLNQAQRQRLSNRSGLVVVTLAR